MLFAYGLTEPDVGADLASVRTRAVHDGDGVVINGAKRFCTGAKIADFHLHARPQRSGRAPISEPEPDPGAA